jgi:steroid delta-isomerase-like uncharacterized protein
MMDLLDLARRHIEAENEHDLEKTMETIGEAGAEYRVYPTGEEFSSREDIRKFYAETYWAFPDMRVEVQNLIQDTPRRQAFLQYKFEATFERPIWGLAPTGRKFSYNGAILYEFDESGKLTKELNYFDKTELLHSMGIILDSNTTLGQFFLIFPQNPFYLLKVLWTKLFGKRPPDGGTP